MKPAAALLLLLACAPAQAQTGPQPTGEKVYMLGMPAELQPAQIPPAMPTYNQLWKEGLDTVNTIPGTSTAFPGDGQAPGDNNAPGPVTGQ